MKIVILNGNPNTEKREFDDYIEKVSLALSQKGNETVVLNLREMKLDYCIGCFSCWIKTPGKCVLKDDVYKILEEYLSSDIVLFSSPIVMGFISSILKTVQERCLPLAHPFFYVDGDRLQHIPRYEKYPSIALLLGAYKTDDSSYVGTIEKIFRNSRTRKFLFTKTTESKPEEVAYALNNI